MAEEKVVREDEELQVQRRSLLSYLNPFYNVVTLTDLYVFTKYFATLVRSGVPILRALRILANQTHKPYFRQIILDIREEVLGGIPLNIAFSRRGDIFSPIYVNLIKTGEESGRLYLVLERLADMLDRQIKLRRKVLAAMWYPAVVSVVAAGVVIFLLTYVIPKFEKIFKQFGQQLPKPTQIVINVSNWFLDNYLLVAAVILLIFLIYYQANSTETGKRFIDAQKLKLPLFGELNKKYNVAQFSRSLAILFRSGITILNAIKLAQNAMENLVLRDAINGIIGDIEGGSTIARALAKTDIMPEIALSMIAVGEEAGNLDDMLERVADFYEDEITFIVDTITSMIEPALIVILGLIVGGIVFAMYLPIFRMARVVTRGGGAKVGPGL